MVTLFWDPGGSWGWITVITMLIFFVCTICLVALEDAVVGVLIIGGMYSMVFWPEVVGGIVMVGIVARIIIKYGVWGE